MQLTDMKVDFLKMGGPERTAFIVAYTEARRVEMEQSEVIIKAKAKRGGRKKAAPTTLKVTPEQLALMKKLGLI